MSSSVESVSGMSTSRLEAFSDGVFAIAITLLILDLRLPTGVGDAGLAHALVSGDLLAQYAAYVVSFLVIGITWMNHHTLYQLIARTDRLLLVLNLLLLLGLSFLPFPTRVLAEYIRGHGRRTLTPPRSSTARRWSTSVGCSPSCGGTPARTAGGC